MKRNKQPAGCHNRAGHVARRQAARTQSGAPSANAARGDSAGADATQAASSSTACRRARLGDGAGSAALQRTGARGAQRAAWPRPARCSWRAEAHGATLVVHAILGAGVQICLSKKS
jgi:hypothetical protein